MRIHILQYEVWKKSMFIRYLIEAAIFFTIAIFFQLYISRFNNDVHIMGADIERLENWLDHDDYIHFDEYWKEYNHYLENTIKSSVDFDKALYLSLICFSFPVRTLMIIVFA
jgi:hypothetical protein